MADVQDPPPPNASTAAPTVNDVPVKTSSSSSSSSSSPQPPSGQTLIRPYSIPFPVRTFPLPAFYPNNPISLVHLVSAWLKQVIFPPSSEPSIIYIGYWSPETGSVHIIDPQAIRALWEQGFFGKGHLSRSEPNWFKREQVRRGLVQGHVSEILTVERRQERIKAKWERARLEQEAICNTRLREQEEEKQRLAALEQAKKPNEAAEESESAESDSDSIVMPKSSDDRTHTSIHVVAKEAGKDEEEDDDDDEDESEDEDDDSSSSSSSHDSSVDVQQQRQQPQQSSEPHVYSSPVGPMQLLALPNSLAVKLVDASVPLIIESDTTTHAIVTAIENKPLAKPLVVDVVAAAPADADIITASAPKSLPAVLAPVGPLELLSLPNSSAVEAFAEQVTQKVAEIAEDEVFEEEFTEAIEDAIHEAIQEAVDEAVQDNDEGASSPNLAFLAPVGPMQLLALPNSLSNSIASLDDTLVESTTTLDHDQLSTSSSQDASAKNTNITSAPSSEYLFSSRNLSKELEDAEEETPSEQTFDSNASQKNSKSVRFSPKIEPSALELVADDTSESESQSSSFSEEDEEEEEEEEAEIEKPTQETETASSLDIETSSTGSLKLAIGSEDSEEESDDAEESKELVDKERLQLLPEEAFFLTFGLGLLSVLDPSTKQPLSTRELLCRFRQHSYYPPRTGTDPKLDALYPDDPFLVNYAVYHHFRSLGWVPRGGIKFGVDWLLYNRGPALDHAEFGLMVMPSFSDAWWKDAGKTAPARSWQWLHGVNRVLSHVTKSLVLVYVDIPPPPIFEEALAKGIKQVFELYKVREVMFKRWSSNRNRKSTNTTQK